MLTDKQDAFGHEIYDYFKRGKQGSPILEIVERDDGYIDFHGGPEAYFSEYKDWHPYQKKAMKYVRGRILDIGCGAGRHALYLQKNELDVVGIDNSPLAIKVCKQRGLKDARVISINQISPELGVFDTIIMMGNNFGLFGSLKGARRLLKKMSKITSPKARIIAETNDVYKTDMPEHLDYHKLNKKRGRMSGQIRLRVRRKKHVTPWIDYLMVSKDEMEDILDSTDWYVKKYIDSPGSIYIAVIEKKY
ncbi:MAG: class I SAM-dependent methyltransferase [Dehalococcoidales bacterium]|nr:class I SAM-dependent methyltransferase [Dehalococcoidales bacterium]